MKRRERVLVGGAWGDHRYRFGFIVVLLVLGGSDADMVARLKIADIRLAGGGGEVFGRRGDGDGLVILVLVLEADVLLVNSAQGADQRGIARLVWALTVGSVLWIAPARHSTARKSNTGTAKDDLTETGQAGQQENRQ